MESDAHSVRVVLTAVAPPPPHPHLSELLPRERRQVHREPSRDPPEDLGDALLGRHSKLYQRRKEVEAELKQEFSLPEEATAVLHELRSRRSTPLGCPPPVPKPRMGKSKLPPIPKLPEQHRPPRWGVGDASENIATAQDQADAQTPWWKLEQEILARRSSDRQLTAEHVDQRDQAEEAGEDFTTFDRTLQKRPQSWRMGRPDQLRSGGENASQQDVPRLPGIQRHQEEGSHGSQPWRLKAQELEAVAAAHRVAHARRKEVEAVGRESNGYPAAESEAAVRAPLSREQLNELHRREEQRFEEMRREELRRLQLEREETKMRRQEQEEWEHAMRRKFIEEAEQLKAARRAQREVEELQEKKWKEGAQRRQAMRQEEVREREEAKKRRQEQEEWEQAMRRKIAAEEQQNEEFRRRQAEEKRSRAQASQHEHGTEPKAKMGMGTSEFRFSERPHVAQPSPPRHPHPSQSPQGGRRGRLKSTSTSSRNADLRSSSAQLQAAKAAAMRQLIMLKQNPSKEARHKGFKELLRLWHPDKNPGSAEVATTVFQMIQAERGRVFK